MMPQMKFVIDQLECIYNSLQDKNEIAIYNKYGNIAKYITTTCLSKKKQLSAIHIL